MSASDMPADTSADRLARQIAFIVEIDKLKGVLRQTTIADGSRRENTAEHSWQLAMCALVLCEHANQPVDVSRVVEMLLVHDLVEIDAGDMFVYGMNDPAVAAKQEAAELAGADRIFSMLPVEQGSRLRARWDEFEAKQTPEAKFAKAIDRMVPMLLNTVSGGGSWKTHSITADKTRALIDATMPAGSTVLTEFAHDLINKAVADGILASPKPINPE
jgi:putative hydrolases of HD superfamily